jgi:hypothetical protein
MLKNSIWLSMHVRKDLVRRWPRELENFGHVRTAVTQVDFDTVPMVGDMFMTPDLLGLVCIQHAVSAQHLRVVEQVPWFEVSKRGWIRRPDSQVLSLHVELEAWGRDPV